jgi:DTW domain-containing protein YfiP
VTRSRIVLLMHTKEYRHERCGTGRLACLNLANAEIIPGDSFDNHPRVRELADDPANMPFLLYPGPGAVNLSEHGFAALGARLLGNRKPLVFLIDSTWSCSRSLLRASPDLQALPRLAFEPRELSRWLIKRQPRSWCLSTIESIHELLLALEAAGLDSYPDKTRLLDVFAEMQDYQITRAEAAGHARRYRPPRQGCT